jgi:hypothetical protein
MENSVLPRHAAFVPACTPNPRPPSRYCASMLCKTHRID